MAAAGIRFGGYPSKQAQLDAQALARGEVLVAEDAAGEIVNEQDIPDEDVEQIFFTPKGVELSQSPMRFNQSVSEGALKDANENFIVEEQLDFFKGRDDEFYANYDKVYSEAEAAGDIAGMNEATEDRKSVV